MTRRELARHLSKDLLAKGPHFHHGSTVYQTVSGEWGAFVGLHKPPLEALWYELEGWDRVAERNTVLKVEKALYRLEKQYTGKARKINRATLANRGY